jgi:NAD(P)H dehydrogenase (quinone)
MFLWDCPSPTIVRNIEEELFDKFAVTGAVIAEIIREANDMRLLLTGATGKLGSKVAASLLQSVPADQLAVSVRDPDKAKNLRSQGVDVRKGDFNLPETLDAAFSGVERLLIISTMGDDETRIRQHTNAVAAAKRAGVHFIAYTSIADAQESHNAMATVHKATEKAILQSGIPYSFLRNNWYLENETLNIQRALAGSDWITSAGKGKVGWASQQDYADAAAAVLSGTGHENAVYELSGPLLTQAQLAAALSDVLGKKITVRQVDDTVYRQTLKASGLPDSAAAALVRIQKDIREGTLEVESTDFEKVLGRPLTPIKEALRKIVKALAKTRP